MHTTIGTPEDYTASYATIPVSGAHGLKCWEARRTGIEPHSGRAVYELVGMNGKPVSNILYVIDDAVLVPVAAFRTRYVAARQG